MLPINHRAFVNRIDYEHMTELAKEAQKGDRVAMEELIVGMRPMVEKIARAYAIAPETAKDLAQEGNIALFECIKRFDRTQALFPTFASFAIMGVIQAKAYEMQKVVGASRSTHVKNKRVANVIEKHAVEKGTREIDETVKEQVSIAMGKDNVTEEEIKKRARMARLAEVYSLERAASDRFSRDAKFAGNLINESTPSPYVEAVRTEQRRILSELFAKLNSPKKRQVMELLISDRELTMEEVGSIVGFSKQRVEQITKEVMGKIGDMALYRRIREEQVA